LRFAHLVGDMIQHRCPNEMSKKEENDKIIFVYEWIK